MKRIYIFFLLILLLIISCSPVTMLDIKDYKGDMDDIFNDNNGKLDVNFSGNSTITLTLTIDTWDDERDITFSDGSYYVETDYHFCADLDEGISFNVVLWKNIIDSSGIEDMADIDLADYDSIKLKLELEGKLNSYQGKGEGDYKMRCYAKLNNGDTRNGEIKGDWVLVVK